MKKAQELQDAIRAKNYAGDMTLFNGFDVAGTDDTKVLERMLERSRTDQDRCECGTVFCTQNWTRNKCDYCEWEALQAD